MGMIASKHNRLRWGLGGAGGAVKIFLDMRIGDEQKDTISPDLPWRHHF
jgi:hypothetical protein